MKTLAKLGLTLTLLVGVSAFVAAGDEAKSLTVEGKVMCAKCQLKKADANKCQDVLVVAEGEAKGEYYIVKNDVATQFGHVCQGEKAARVTGTVAEKDGKMWITASAMEEVKG